jgi:hypothetical protein
MKGHILGKLLSLTIILFWLGMMGWLVKRSYFSPNTGKPIMQNAIAPPSIPYQDTLLDNQQEWLGIYLNDTKIGFVSRSIKKITGGYYLKEVAEFRMKLMEIPQQVSMITAAKLDFQYTVQSFQFKMTSQDTQLSITGRVRDKTMELAVTTGKQTSHQSLLLEQVPQLPINLPLYLARKDLIVGDYYQIPFFDPTTFSNDILTIKVLQKDELRIAGRKVEAYKIEESFKGLAHYIWISPEGEILREEAPMGITLIKESQEKALESLPTEGAQIDLVYAMAIEVKTKLPHPELLKYLKLRLTNVSLDDFPLSSERQRLQDNILEIEVEEIEKFPSAKLTSLSQNDPSLKKLLAPSTLVQSDHPKIQQLARSIIGGEDNALRALQRLAQWVYTNVDKQPTVSIPSALEVLASKVGDCNEHTVLFTALARAANIPTKMVAGLLYHEGRFFYHAWAECFIGRWIAVDPLMNQIPSDATHVKIVEGNLDQQVNLLKIIGQLQIEILAYH